MNSANKGYDTTPSRTRRRASARRRVRIDGAVVHQLFDCYLDQILVDGFVHVDPHPGNLLLTADGRLALIDLGMVARVSPQMQDSLIRLLVALSEGRGTEVAAVMAALGEQRE